VTIKIPAESISERLLVLSISARSVPLFAARSKPDILDDADLAADNVLSLVTIPTEVDPEHANMSLLGGHLVLVLPVATSSQPLPNQCRLDDALLK